MMNAPLIIAVVLASAVLIVGFSRRREKPRHRRNLKRAKRILGRFAGLTDGEIVAYLRKIDPYVFEELVLEAFRRSGYRIWRNRRYSGDGGMDGRMEKGGIRYIVQCKRYSGDIHLEHVRQFVQLCRVRDTAGVFVHTGRTGSGIHRYLHENGDASVLIYSGGRLASLLRNAASSRGGRTI